MDIVTTGNREKEMLHHYTTGPRLPLIRKAGALLPLGAKLSTVEFPQLWFSTREDYEPAILKLQVLDGRLMRPTFEQLSAQMGCYRFIVREQVLLRPFIKLCRQARIPASDVDALAQLCTELGSSTDQWFGTIAPVMLSNLDFEVWRGGTWRKADFNLETSQLSACRARCGLMAA